MFPGTSKSKREQDSDAGSLPKKAKLTSPLEGASSSGPSMAVLDGEANQFLERLWNSVSSTGAHSDVRLTFKNAERLDGHRVVLAAASPYLEELLSHGKYIVELTSLSKKCFLDVLMFSLGGRLHVDCRKDLNELLDASRLLEMPQLTRRCGEVLEENLSVSNCLSTLDFADKIWLPELIRTAEKYVCDHYEEVAGTEEWRALSADQMESLLKMAKRMQVGSKVRVDATLEWLKSADRVHGRVASVLRLLPLQDMPADFLSGTLIMHPNVLGNKEAIEVVMEIIQSRLARGTTTTAASPSLPVTSGACSTYGGQEEEAKRKTRPLSLVVGGWVDGQTVLHVWTTGSGTWVRFPTPLPRHGLGAAMALFKGQLFITGGRVNISRAEEAQSTPTTQQSRSPADARPNYVTQSITSIVNLQSRNVATGPQMCHQRFEHGMVKVGKSLYAAGGGNKVIEEYNDNRKTWMKVGQLLLKVKDCGIGAVGSVIYVVGGAGDQGQNRHVQAFDTATTGSPTVLHGLLPVDMLEVRFAGVNQDKAIFLSSKGHLVEVFHRDDVRHVNSNVKYEEEMKPDFGVYLQGKKVLVCTRAASTNEFRKYALLSKNMEANSGVPSLPQAVRVYGIATTRKDV